MKSTFFVKLICLCLLLTLSGCRDKLSEQRNNFLLAEKNIAANNEAGFLSASENLKDYLLYPYLHYEWLQGHLNQTSQITSFLTEHRNTRFAPLLRGKWLNALAEQNRWQEFVQNYQQDEHSKDDCRWYWARYQVGDTQQALIETKRLWLAGTTSNECQLLFTLWLNVATISSDLIWQRFEATLLQNKVSAAKAAAEMFKPAERQKAENWLQLHASPAQLENKRFWKDKNAQSARFFADALIRLADSDLNKAVAVWGRSHKEFTLDDRTRQLIEKKFGMELLADKDIRAFNQLSKVSQPDAELRAAKLRAALIAPNWQQLSLAVADLTEEERKDPRAQYWYARTLEENGDNQQAEALYKTLSQDRSFYGFMAADKLKMPYQIADQPIKPDMNLLAELAEQPEFKACREFAFFGRDLEVRRQWRFALKGLSKEQLLAAAKMAQVLQWDQLAITTLVKAGYWDDMGLRFPVRYLREVAASAQKYGLDPALVMGLIRQESMLDPKATSTVGALGLMQMMPQTAMAVAAELKQPALNDKTLYRPEINIDYGTYYLSGLVARLGKRIPVAVAAYNAGPNRVKKWLPAASTIPADIWIETIPYKETRQYVANVLTYAIIYQARLQKTSLKLKDLLTEVGPV